MKEMEGRHILGVIGGTELLGAERGMIQALLALKEAGCTITVAVSDRIENGGAVGKQCRELDFVTFTVPMGSHFTRRWMLLDHNYRKAQFRRILQSSRQLRKEVRARQPDTILLGSTLSYAFLGLALFQLKTPIVFRVGDAPIIESRFHLWLWRSLARRSSAIVCISHFIRSQSEGHVRRGKPIHVIPNIAPLRVTPLDEDEVNLLQQSKRPNQGVYVGQITSQKGVPDLVEALIALDDPNTGCWILGGSPHTRKLEEALSTTVKNSTTQTRIEFMGFIEDPRAYLKAADWHIAPSTYAEPLGNVVQEAKSQGTPSIITPKGGLPETLTPNRTGWVLEGDGARHIEDGIRRIQRPEWTLAERDVLEESAQTNNSAVFRNRWVSVIQSILKS